MRGRINAKEKQVREDGTKRVVRHHYRHVQPGDVAPVTAGLRGEQMPEQQPQGKPQPRQRPRLRTPFG